MSLKKMIEDRDIEGISLYMKENNLSIKDGKIISNDLGFIKAQISFWINDNKPVNIWRPYSVMNIE